jgi:3-oxoadipate enol-lactonase
MRITTDDGVGLATVAAGDPAAPGLLLVHGIGGAKEDFTDHFEVLARDHRVVAFDLRGHGASDAPTNPTAYSLDRMAADAAAVADALELHDLRILGHSMGGMVVRRWVLAEPERFAAVVLMDTSAAMPPGFDPDVVAAAIEIVQTQGLAALKQLTDELDLLGSPAYQRVLAERPGFQEYAEYKWSSQSPVMWAAMVRELIAQPDQLAEMASLEVATLGIVGDQDVTFMEAVEAIVATVPCAELTVIPDAGHSPQFENPPAWREAVTTFLARL